VKELDAMVLSIVIPCFDEASTIDTIVARAIDAPPVHARKEIIIVDDGSTDASPSIVEGLPRRYADRPDIAFVLLRHPSNRGKGAALRTGLARATGDVIIIQDADLEYDPQDYPKLIGPIAAGRASAVFGTRRDCRRLSRTQPRHWRYIAAARLLTGLANALFGTKLTDYATGYKAFARSAAEALRLTTDGFEVDAEITARLRKLGYEIVEVPIRYQPRTVSEGKKIRSMDALRAAWTMVRERMR
jgi:dolichol-phosphate mannosyltransferase